MKLSTLLASRAMMVLALGLGLSACGGKATFDIKGSISGLKYDGLILTETFSGAKVTVPAGSTTFAFPGSIEYGTQYKVVIASTGPLLNQPAHQDCVVGNGADTAGRQAAINVIVACSVQTHNLTGAITVTATGGATKGLPTGLKLINGSDSNGIVATDTSVDYAFQGIEYGTGFGLIIAAQPTSTKTTCVLNPTPPLVVVDATKLAVKGDMGDANAVVNVDCTTVP
jgi:hypothetical protein